MTTPLESAAPLWAIVLRALAYAGAATLLLLYAPDKTTFIYMGF
jgi:hypothetical protein